MSNEIFELSCGSIIGDYREDLEELDIKDFLTIVRAVRKVYTSYPDTAKNKDKNIAEGAGKACDSIIGWLEDYLIHENCSKEELLQVITEWEKDNTD